MGRGYIWTISPIVNSIANIKDKHKYVLKIYINNDLIDVKFSSCNGLTLQQCTCALRALNVWRIHLFFLELLCSRSRDSTLMQTSEAFTGTYIHHVTFQ